MNMDIKQIIEENPRFTIERRVFQDYEVLRSWDRTKFNKWSEWKPYYSYFSGDISEVYKTYQTFVKNAKHHNVTFEYRIVNNFPHHPLLAMYNRYMEIKLKIKLHKLKNDFKQMGLGV
jgi:hypothetical protein